jgi:2-amino-4-hydroxy-6-hydroxymethyldihydropteridine diphosphokinase
MIKNTSNVYLHRLKFSQSGPTCGSNCLFLGLGANIAGRWGSPEETLLRALGALAQAGLEPLATSRFFVTKPVGGARQPDFLNAVIRARASLAPLSLLRLVKALERQAGRRPGRRWGPRPLDIDILDYGGRRLGRPEAKRQHDRLILPHPELHRRAFVLVPLAEIAPRWRHPGLGASVSALLHRLGPRARREVVAKPLISRPPHAKSRAR